MLKASNPHYIPYIKKKRGGLYDLYSYKKQWKKNQWGQTVEASAQYDKQDDLEQHEDVSGLPHSGNH